MAADDVNKESLHSATGGYLALGIEMSFARPFQMRWTAWMVSVVVMRTGLSASSASAFADAAG